MVISDPHLEYLVDQPITKRLRMSRERAKRLARLAKTRGTSESAVLRDAMDLLEKQTDVLRRRREHIQGLIDMIEGPEPKKIQFGLK